MFSADEINRQVDEHIAKAQEENANFLVLAKAEEKDGKWGAGLYAYAKVNDNFGAGAYLGWDGSGTPEFAVEAKVKF